MTTTFETAKVGDRVWCMRAGWGEIRDDRRASAAYPIHVYFSNDEFKTYTVDGLYDADDITQSLFWDEVKIEAPQKPLPDLEVDAKVLVWSDHRCLKLKRHFSHFENGVLRAFDRGHTSWTGGPTSAWPNWELAE